MGRRRKARLSREPETVTIESLSHDGRGVARVDGKVVFVDGALPGETVRMTRMRTRKSHDDARTDEVLVAAESRVQPKCAHFGVCGGCLLQHMAADEQLAHKQSHLLENLARIGSVEPGTVLEPLAGPTWAYRRRARLAVKDVPGKGRVLVGFRERFKPYVTVMERCEVLAAPAGSLIQPLSELVGAMTIRRELPQIEVAVTDEVTALVFRTLGTPSTDDLDLLRRFEKDHDVRIYLQPGGLDTVEPLGDERSALTYAVSDTGLVMRFEPTDFIQINAAINDALVDRVRSLMSLTDDDRVLELFCGLGNFTLPIAAEAGHVVAVEGDRNLVDRARANALANGIDNVDWHTADLFDDLSGASWLAGEYSQMLLDPPRSGAGPIIERCRDLGVRRIVYVSCHPATLARDAAILCGTQGFRLVAAGVADMFPHTAHVESVALFEADGS